MQKKAAYYPLRLLRAILDGMMDTQDAQQHGSRLSEDDWDAHLTMSIHQPPPAPGPSTDKPHSSIPKVAGGTVNIHYHPHNVKTQYLDEYTREILPLELVKAAMVDELD